MKNDDNTVEFIQKFVRLSKETYGESSRLFVMVACDQIDSDEVLVVSGGTMDPEELATNFVPVLEDLWNRVDSSKEVH